MQTLEIGNQIQESGMLVIQMGTDIVHSGNSIYVK